MGTAAKTGGNLLRTILNFGTCTLLVMYLLLLPQMLREQGVGGSNPLAPTSYKKSAPEKDRSFVFRPVPTPFYLIT